ncbi:MAG: histidine kinase [Sphingobacterium sp.]|jgi:hypothetical protein|nr:histidine kinase [Sphingobacterium sp.]
MMNQTSSYRDSFFTEMGKRVLIVVSAFFLHNIVSYLIDPLSYFWDNYPDHSWTFLLSDWLISFLFCFAVSEASIRIGKKLNEYIPWTESPFKRLLLESGATLIVVLFLLYFQSLIFAATLDDETAGQPLTIEDTLEAVRWLAVSLIISFVIMAIHTGDYLITSWKNAALKAMELNQLATEAELQSLKLQLDPHFVFNNLSVLSELILTDQQLGHEYAENFTKLYRCLLVHAKQDLVLLEDELNLLQAYIFLLEQRIGDGLSFEININESCNQLQIPPMTLQMLVENALKHNKTRRSNPLRIRIFTDDRQNVVVENTMIPLRTKVPSSGIGLTNIIRRYGLLGKIKPKIYHDNEKFSVTAPLLK